MEYSEGKMKGIYKRLYICPKAETCLNKGCFMRTPRNRHDYHNVLGHNVLFSKCIERFNEIFECGGMKLNLQEFRYNANK